MRNLKMRLAGAAVGFILIAMALGWFGPRMLEGVPEHVRVVYLGLAAFVFVGLCGVAFHGMLERALKPVMALTDHFVRMRAGDLNPRLPAAGPDEMQQLSRTFNEMMEELELQIREVTEEKYAAERGRQYLQEQVEACQRFKDLADAAPIGIVLSDADLNVVYHNSASEAGFLQLTPHLNWNTEIVVGRSLSFLYPKADHARSALSAPDNLPFEATATIGPFVARYVADSVYSADGERAGCVLVWELEQATEGASSVGGSWPGTGVEAESPLGEKSVEEGPKADSGKDRPDETADPHVARNSDLVGRGVRMVSDRLATVASMVEALRNEEENLRATLEEVHSRTQSAALLTTERSESLWEMVDESRDRGERASATASIIKRLRKGLSDAEAIPSNVNRLSDAIQLMVMQARVEAVRAGQAGSGMKAVVDEVKRLGRDASRLGKDVDKRLERIREEVDEALSVLEDDRHQTRAAGRVARRAETALRRIEQDLSEVNERTNLVAEMADGQSEIGGQIAEQLDQIGQLVEMTVRVARDPARLAGGKPDEETEDQIEEGAS